MEIEEASMESRTFPEPTSALRAQLARGTPLSIITVVDAVIADASRCGASDIHIDPTEHDLKVQMRIDGILQDLFHLEKTIHAEIISRIKVLAHLRTDEHQHPQDGRFRFELSDKKFIDVRVSIMPTFWGENAVLRLLGISQEFTLAALGFSTEDEAKIAAALARPHGMI